MAFSTQTAVSDGTLTALLISIEYFDREDITVTFDGVPNALPWAWVGVSEKAITFTPAVPSGVTVGIQRTTDISSPRHIFTLGAQFTAQSVDEDLQQVLYIAQEAREGGWGESTSTLRADLANTTPSKGAALVGYADPVSLSNTSVKATLDLIRGGLGASAVGFTHTGVGAVSQTVHTKLTATINAADFGAVADGVSDDAPAIQNAINAVADLGGGFVDLASGTHIIGSTLVLPSKVVLRGQGSSSTVLKAKNALNATIIKSANYDALVGSDTWLVASGNKHAFGLMRLKIDGNKANQTAGSGVQFYGKRLYIDNVIITSCKDEGWHSESNQTILGAPATNGDDFPEGLIRGLYIWQCDSHGFVFRGQHDTYIESLFVGVCGGWGVRFESDTSAPGVYSGNCDSGFMHVYANVAGGIFINQFATHQCSLMISENNDGVGLQCDGWQVKVAQLQMYSNCRVTGTYQAVIAGSECKFPSIHVKDTGNSKGGVQITGNKNNCHITAIGAGSTGCAVDVSGIYNQLNATIDNWSGAGGIGLRTGNSSQLQHGKIVATINACTTCWNNATVGSYNDYTISGFAAAGKAFFSGSGPNTGKTENWNVKGVTNGVTPVLSENRIRTINALDLNSTAEQEITVAHGLVTTPLIQDVIPVVVYLNANQTWQQSRLYVRSVDATNVKVRFKASVAAGGADVADLITHVKL